MAFSANAKLNPWIKLNTGNNVYSLGHSSFKTVVYVQRNRALSTVRMAASPSTSTGSDQAREVYEEGQLERPRWTGETPLSRLVGAIISFKPFYSILKYGARQVLIRSSF